jgi:hypothetical protein
MKSSTRNYTTAALTPLYILLLRLHADIFILFVYAIHPLLSFSLPPRFIEREEAAQKIYF